MSIKVVLRADANEAIATGHVYRLLALAEVLKPHYEVWFCTQSNDEQLLKTISSQVHKLIKLPNLFKYCLPSDKLLNDEIPFDLVDMVNPNDIVVLDGYWFREKYQLAVKNMGAKLVMIDDFADQYFYADIVINHAPGLSIDKYKGEEYTQYFLGLNYSLIRKPFFEPRTSGIISTKQTIFICFGGSDTYGLSVKYSKVILEQTNYNVKLLMSQFNQDNAFSAIDKLALTYPNHFNIYVNLSAVDLKNLLDTCTNAIVPASTILFECISRGLKCLSGYYTDNQRMIYSGFLNGKMIVGIENMIHFNTNALFPQIAKTEKLDTIHSKMDSTRHILSLFNNLC